MAAAWVWLGAPSIALADAPSVHLEWPRPVASTCVPASVLEQDVEGALGRPVFTTRSSARMYIRATIEDGPSGVWVRLEARAVDGTMLGTRELRAPAGQCAELRSGIGLVLTLLIEREELASEPAALQLDVGLWAGALINVLPALSFGAGPSLVLSAGSAVQLRADAAYWLPVAIETARGLEADVQPLSLALRICPRLAGRDQDAGTLQVCGGAQLGALITTQTAPDGAPAQTRLLAQGVVELRGALRAWGSSRLELAAGPTLALHRTTIFAVHGDGARSLVYRVPTWGAILSLAFII